MSSDSEWNGLRIPPRPPLPVPHTEPATQQRPPAPPADAQATRPDAETPEPTAAPVRRIGMPPGMDLSPDTVPSSDHAAPVPVRRPEFPVAPTPVPPAANSVPGTAAPAPVTAPAPVAVAPVNPRLVLPDGVELPLERGLFVGRDPEEQPGYGVTRRARLHDVERSVSKTHALVGVSDGRVWVIDLNSTNGTTMIASDGAETPCAPVVATPVPAGTDLRFGEYRVQVVAD